MGQTHPSYKHMLFFWLDWPVEDVEELIYRLRYSGVDNFQPSEVQQNSLCGTLKSQSHQAQQGSSSTQNNGTSAAGMQQSSTSTSSFSSKSIISGISNNSPLTLTREDFLRFFSRRHDPRLAGSLFDQVLLKGSGQYGGGGGGSGLGVGGGNGNQQGSHCSLPGGGIGRKNTYRSYGVSGGSNINSNSLELPNPRRVDLFQVLTLLILYADLFDLGPKQDEDVELIQPQILKRDEELQRKIRGKILKKHGVKVLEVDLDGDQEQQNKEIQKIMEDKILIPNANFNFTALGVTALQGTSSKRQEFMHKMNNQIKEAVLGHDQNAAQNEGNTSGQTALLSDADKTKDELLSIAGPITITKNDIKSIKSDSNLNTIEDDSSSFEHTPSEFSSDSDLGTTMSIKRSDSGANSYVSKNASSRGRGRGGRGSGGGGGGGVGRMRFRQQQSVLGIQNLDQFSDLSMFGSNQQQSQGSTVYSKRRITRNLQKIMVIPKKRAMRESIRQSQLQQAQQLQTQQQTQQSNSLPQVAQQKNLNLNSQQAQVQQLQVQELQQPHAVVQKAQQSKEDSIINDVKFDIDSIGPDDDEENLENMDEEEDEKYQQSVFGIQSQHSQNPYDPYEEMGLDSTESGQQYQYEQFKSNEVRKSLNKIQDEQILGTSNLDNNNSNSNETLLNQGTSTNATPYQPIPKPKPYLDRYYSIDEEFDFSQLNLQDMNLIDDLLAEDLLKDVHPQLIETLRAKLEGVEPGVNEGNQESGIQWQEGNQNQIPGSKTNTQNIQIDPKLNQTGSIGAPLTGPQQQQQLQQSNLKAQQGTSTVKREPSVSGIIINKQRVSNKPASNVNFAAAMVETRDLIIPSDSFSYSNTDVDSNENESEHEVNSGGVKKTVTVQDNVTVNDNDKFNVLDVTQSISGDDIIDQQQDTAFSSVASSMTSDALIGLQQQSKGQKFEDESNFGDDLNADVDYSATMSQRPKKAIVLRDSQQDIVNFRSFSTDFQNIQQQIQQQNQEGQLQGLDIDSGTEEPKSNQNSVPMAMVSEPLSIATDSATLGGQSGQTNPKFSNSKISDKQTSSSTIPSTTSSVSKMSAQLSKLQKIHGPQHPIFQADGSQTPLFDLFRKRGKMNNTSQNLNSSVSNINNNMSLTDIHESQTSMNSESYSISDEFLEQEKSLMTVDLLNERVWQTRLELLFNLFDFNRNGTIQLPDQLMFMVKVIEMSITNLVMPSDDTLRKLDDFKSQIDQMGRGRTGARKSYVSGIGATEELLCKLGMGDKVKSHVMNVQKRQQEEQQAKEKLDLAQNSVNSSGKLKVDQSKGIVSESIRKSQSNPILPSQTPSQSMNVGTVSFAIGHNVQPNSDSSDANMSGNQYQQQSSHQSSSQNPQSNRISFKQQSMSQSMSGNTNQQNLYQASASQENLNHLSDPSYLTTDPEIQEKSQKPYPNADRGLDGSGPARNTMTLLEFKHFMTVEQVPGKLLRNFLESSTCFKQSDFFIPKVVMRRYRSTKLKHSMQMEHLEDMKSRYLTVAGVLTPYSHTYFLVPQFEVLLQKLDRRLIIQTFLFEELVQLLSEASRKEQMPKTNSSGQDHTRVLKEISLVQWRMEELFDKSEVMLFEMASEHFSMETYPLNKWGETNMNEARIIRQEDCRVEDSEKSESENSQNLYDHQDNDLNLKKQKHYGQIASDSDEYSSSCYNPESDENLNVNMSDHGDVDMMGSDYGNSPTSVISSEGSKTQNDNSNLLYSKDIVGSIMKTLHPAQVAQKLPDAIGSYSGSLTSKIVKKHVKKKLLQQSNDQQSQTQSQNLNLNKLNPHQIYYKRQLNRVKVRFPDPLRMHRRRKRAEICKRRRNNLLTIGSGLYGGLTSGSCYMGGDSIALRQCRKDWLRRFQKARKTHVSYTLGHDSGLSRRRLTKNIIGSNGIVGGGQRQDVFGQKLYSSLNGQQGSWLMQDQNSSGSEPYLSLSDADASNSSEMIVGEESSQSEKEDEQIGLDYMIRQKQKQEKRKYRREQKFNDEDFNLIDIESDLGDKINGDDNDDQSDSDDSAMSEEDYESDVMIIDPDSEELEKAEKDETGKTKIVTVGPGLGGSLNSPRSPRSDISFPHSFVGSPSKKQDLLDPKTASQRKRRVKNERIIKRIEKRRVKEQNRRGTYWFMGKRKGGVQANIEENLTEYDKMILMKKKNWNQQQGTNLSPSQQEHHGNQEGNAGANKGGLSSPNIVIGNKNWSAPSHTQNLSPNSISNLNQQQNQSNPVVGSTNLVLNSQSQPNVSPSDGANTTANFSTQTASQNLNPNTISRIEFGKRRQLLKALSRRIDTAMDINISAKSGVSGHKIVGTKNVLSQNSQSQQNRGLNTNSKNIHTYAGRTNSYFGGLSAINADTISPKSRKFHKTVYQRSETSGVVIGPFSRGNEGLKRMKKAQQEEEMAEKMKKDKEKEAAQTAAQQKLASEQQQQNMKGKGKSERIGGFHQQLKQAQQAEAKQAALQQQQQNELKAMSLSLNVDEQDNGITFQDQSYDPNSMPIIIDEPGSASSSNSQDIKTLNNNFLGTGFGFQELTLEGTSIRPGVKLENMGKNYTAELVEYDGLGLGPQSGHNIMETQQQATSTGRVAMIGTGTKIGAEILLSPEPGRKRANITVSEEELEKAIQDRQLKEQQEKNQQQVSTVTAGTGGKSALKGQQQSDQQQQGKQQLQLVLGGKNQQGQQNQQVTVAGSTSNQNQANPQSPTSMDQQLNREIISNATNDSNLKQEPRTVTAVATVAGNMANNELDQVQNKNLSNLNLMSGTSGTKLDHSTVIDGVTQYQNTITVSNDPQSFPNFIMLPEKINPLTDPTPHYNRMAQLLAPVFKITSKIPQDQIEKQSKKLMYKMDQLIELDMKQRKWRPPPFVPPAGCDGILGPPGSNQDYNGHQYTSYLNIPGEGQQGNSTEQSGQQQTSNSSNQQAAQQQNFNYTIKKSTSNSNIIKPFPWTAYQNNAPYSFAPPFERVDQGGLGGLRWGNAPVRGTFKQNQMSPGSGGPVGGPGTGAVVGDSKSTQSHGQQTSQQQSHGIHGQDLNQPTSIHITSSDGHHHGPQINIIPSPGLISQSHQHHHHHHDTSHHHQDHHHHHVADDDEQNPLFNAQRQQEWLFLEKALRKHEMQDDLISEKSDKDDDDEKDDNIDGGSQSKDDVSIAKSGDNQQLNISSKQGPQSKLNLPIPGLQPPVSSGSGSKLMPIPIPSSSSVLADRGASKDNMKDTQQQSPITSATVSKTKSQSDSDDNSQGSKKSGTGSKEVAAAQQQEQAQSSSDQEQSKHKEDPLVVSKKYSGIKEEIDSAQTTIIVKSQQTQSQQSQESLQSEKVQSQIQQSTTMSTQQQPQQPTAPQKKTGLGAKVASGFVRGFKRAATAAFNKSSDNIDSDKDKESLKDLQQQNEQDSSTNQTSKIQYQQSKSMQNLGSNSRSSTGNIKEQKDKSLQQDDIYNQINNIVPASPDDAAPSPSSSTSKKLAAAVSSSLRRTSQQTDSKPAGSSFLKSALEGGNEESNQNVIQLKTSSSQDTLISNLGKPQEDKSQSKTQTTNLDITHVSSTQLPPAPQHSPPNVHRTPPNVPPSRSSVLRLSQNTNSSQEQSPPTSGVSLIASGAAAGDHGGERSEREREKSQTLGRKSETNLSQSTSPRQDSKEKAQQQGPSASQTRRSLMTSVLPSVAKSPLSNLVYSSPSKDQRSKDRDSDSPTSGGSDDGGEYKQQHKSLSKTSSQGQQQQQQLQSGPQGSFDSTTANQLQSQNQQNQPQLQERKSQTGGPEFQQSQTQQNKPSKTIINSSMKGGKGAKGESTFSMSNAAARMSKKGTIHNMTAGRLSLGLGGGGAGGGDQIQSPTEILGGNDPLKDRGTIVGGNLAGLGGEGGLIGQSKISYKDWVKPYQPGSGTSGSHGQDHHDHKSHSKTSPGGDGKNYLRDHSDEYHDVGPSSSNLLNEGTSGGGGDSLTQLLNDASTLVAQRKSQGTGGGGDIRKSQGPSPRVRISGDVGDIGPGEAPGPGVTSGGIVKKKRSSHDDKN